MIEKKIIAVKQDHRADESTYQVFRMLPNHELRAVGSLRKSKLLTPIPAGENIAK